MRRPFLLILFVLACAAPTLSQGSGGSGPGPQINVASRIVVKASYPTGTRGNVFVSSSTGVAYFCKSATCLANGTGWTSMGGVTNSAGNNVFPLSDGTNIGTSPLTKSGAAVVNTGASGAGPDFEVAVTGDSASRVAIGMNTSDVPRLSFGPGNANRDLFLERVGGANLRFGAPDAASPVAQTTGVQNVVAGTSNTAGADWTFQGSQGTGTGAGGKLIFKVAPAGSTGTSQNALSAAVTINSDLTVSAGGQVSAPSLKATGTAGAGYFEGANQSAAPGTPTSAGRLYWDASNRLSWIGTSGFTRTFDGTANTANRIYVLPDAGGTVGLVNATSGTLPYNNAGLFADSNLFRFDANTIVQRNGTNNQKLCFTGSYTDDSNYTRGCVSASTTAVTIAAESLGTGSANVDIVLTPKGTGAVKFSPDNSYDIGASGATRPRTGYFGTSIVVAADTSLVGSRLSLGNGSGTAARITYGGDGLLRLDNLAGNNFDRLQFGGTSASFPTLKRFGNSLAVRAADDTVPTFSTLTTCSSSGEGAMIPISDSTTTTWGATITGGGANHVLAYCNGSAWTVMAK